MPASLSCFARFVLMCPIEAQRLRLVCSRDEPRALEDRLEVALGEPLALGDHAEAVRARRLGRLGVLEDLLGRHHRVHRRLGLGEARLGAEAAVLRAAARLGVHQRAHVGGVVEALDPGPPGPLDECLDLGVILHLAEPDRLLAGDERRHGGTVCAPIGMIGRRARHRPTSACPRNERTRSRCCCAGSRSRPRWSLIVSVITYLDRAGFRDAAGGEIGWLDALYFGAVSVTSTGYGDITPVTDGAPAGQHLRRHAGGRPVPRHPGVDDARGAGRAHAHRLPREALEEDLARPHHRLRVRGQGPRGHRHRCAPRAWRPTRSS